MPPKSSPQNSLDKRWVISESNIDLQRFIIILFRLNIKAICKVDPKYKIFVDIKLLFHDSLSGFPDCFRHSKNKEIFFMYIISVLIDIHFYFFVCWSLSHRLYRLIILLFKYFILQIPIILTFSPFFLRVSPQGQIRVQSYHHLILRINYLS